MFKAPSFASPPMAILYGARSRHGCSTHAAFSVKGFSFRCPIDPSSLLLALFLSSIAVHFLAFSGSEILVRGGVGVISMQRVEMSESAAKTANLSASRKEVLKLPNYEQYPISQFLSHPSGVQAILNTRALQSFHFLGADTYRCTLPKIQLLNFEATPVMDLRMTLTDTDCKVEMLSCKFEGSKVVERQNNHFSAFMTNCMRWDTNDSGNTVEVDVKLGVTLEIFTQPFALLPVSAVEVPGNVVMQALVDRLVPLLLGQLLQDYEQWVRQQRNVIVGIRTVREDS